MLVSLITFTDHYQDLWNNTPGNAAMQQVLYSDTDTVPLSFPCSKEGDDAGDKRKDHDVWPSKQIWASHVIIRSTPYSLRQN